MNCFRCKKIKPDKKSTQPGKTEKSFRPSLPSEESSEMRDEQGRHRGQPYTPPQQRRTLLQQYRQACEKAQSDCERAKADLILKNEECDRTKAELAQERDERGKSEAGLRIQIKDYLELQRQKDKKREIEHISIQKELLNAKTKLRQTEADLSEAKCKLRREQNYEVLLQKAHSDKEQLGKEVIQLKYNYSILQQDFDEVYSQKTTLNVQLQDTKQELDLAKDEIMGKETEMIRVRGDLDEENSNVRRKTTEERNKMVQRHNEMKVSDEKVNQLQAENGILIQRLQQATNHNQRTEETLQDKEAEISRIKENLNATKQQRERESQTARQTEQKLRQSVEERNRDKNDLTKKIVALQNTLAAIKERMGHDKKQTEAILQQKEQELENLRTSAGTENQRLRSQVEILKTQRDSLVAERDSLQTERESLQKQYTEVKEVAEKFQYRLSKEFSIRLASNETNMENISVKHRPAKIAEKFAQIESKEWVEAKEVLDERSDDEKTNIQFLLNMFECACQRAQKVFDGFFSSEAYRLHSPIAATRDTLPKEQLQNEGSRLQIPDSIQKEIMALLRGACGECDIGSLIQDVVAEIKEKHGEGISPILQDTDVKSFVQACCRLAWQMAVQQPPLMALTSNPYYDDRCHQLWYSSPPPSRSKGVSRYEIDFYIWPELRQSGNVLQKGRVCLKPSV